MKRTEPEFSGSYRKDRAAEDFLAALNDHLVSLDVDYRDDAAPEYPSVFVLGVPRSGTTLLTQVISQYFDMGHVSNLMAAFWRAPIIGLRLQMKLMKQEGPPDFSSDYGQTAGLSGIHEFGYFWSEFLRYQELYNSETARTGEIDWEELLEILSTITNVCGRPFVYKNVLLNWHAAELSTRLARSVFVVLGRNRVDTASSLLRMREAMLEDAEKWVSAKPTAYPQLADLSPIEQVAGQVLCLQQELDSQLESVQPAQLVRLNFEDFCAQPEACLEEVARTLELAGWKAERRKIELPRFRNQKSLPQGFTTPAEVEAVFREMEARLS